LKSILNKLTSEVSYGFENMDNPKYQPRNYRQKFNNLRFTGFQVSYLETDLWIGVDPGSYRETMKRVTESRIIELRQTLDDYIASDPGFATSLTPFRPSKAAPPEVKELTGASSLAGIGPMASVAGLFSREAGKVICENFPVKELVVENGGDIFVLLKEELVLSVFAGDSPLSEKVGMIIPAEMKEIGICTSSGTVGPSLSFGQADAVAVVCKDVLLADAFATALGNKVKSPESIHRVLEISEKFPEIIAVVIICEDKVGVRGELEIKLLK